MPRNLKKFVNPTFTRTVGLEPMRRLLTRHQEALREFDFTVFDGAPTLAREAIQAFFAGPEQNYPEGLVADLHRVAELGNRAGLEVLVARARSFGVVLAPLSGGNRERQDPKHVALSAFLEHPEVFDAASDMLAFSRTSFAEFDGVSEGIEAQLDPSTRDRFEQAARTIFEQDLRGCYCRVGWYDDDDEINLVVTYGAPITTTSVIQEGVVDVICYRAAAHAALCYSAADGRLKISGIPKARRAALSEAFADCILDCPGFFAAPSAQELYTLEPIQRAWPDFRFTHAFDPQVRRIDVIEAQADRVSVDLFGNFERIDWSIVTRDSSEGALTRLREACAGLEFRTGAWRLSHIVMRVWIEIGAPKPARVIVKLKPAAQAIFKRQRFEGQIMELLRRNGFCRDRSADHAALAAE